MQWHPSLRPTGKPRYLEIAEAIRADIEAGVLSPGDRLPSQRSVAQTLGLDFTTVSRGYAQAAKSGYVESFVGRGTFVRALNEGSEDPDPRRAMAEDPMMNMPPEPDDPDLVARMEQGLKHVSANLVPLLRYQSTSGSLQDREAAAQWMLENGIPTSPGRLVVTPGAHSSVHAVLTHLSEPGLTVLCERVTYPGIRAIAAQLGLRLVGVDMDEHGILPDALAEAIREHWPAAVYLNPTLQNPLTFTMPAERRKQVARVLEQYGTPLVEDDACCFVASDAPAPISTLVPQLGWHIAGLSKCLGAGLRLAFTTIPENHPKEPFLQVLRAGSVMPSPLSIALVSRWIEDGTARMMLTAIRKGATERQAVADATLEGCNFRNQSQAFNIWLTLPPGISRAEIMGRMSNAQVGILPSDTFTVSEAKDEALRVCLGGPISLANLTDDLEALRDAVLHKGWVG
ncbi:putative HTH-type transcriptional regulator YdcR [Ruegeria denitrificans]|uniref:Putative HTH-type transcriptional regulator YdcR n=1 Tax=Ruegeria denitrificans TaxID=1715692 RepID=A0A0P1J0F9_9RHOB|nr:PLP-dependent aminotransferase family protein [Ruegeria denitrificans]CUK19618.1 putative HTH-type transcriptional regulator YdcR [Ruegeria denitrificans]